MKSRAPFVVLLIAIGCACAHKVTAPIVQVSIPTPAPATTPLPPLLSSRPPRMQLYGTIDATDIERAMKVVASAIDAKSRIVTIQINSPGGGYGSTVAIMAVMGKARAEWGMRFDCVVDGEGGSGAFIILQECDRRYMTKRSTLMTHMPAYEETADVSLIDSLNHKDDVNATAVAVAEHCRRKLKNVSLATYMEKTADHRQWWFTWEQALEIGAVDMVVENAWELPL